MSARESDPQGDPGRFQETVPTGPQDDPRSLSLRATQAADPAVARELSLRETQRPTRRDQEALPARPADGVRTRPESLRVTEIPPAIVGTLETLAPDAETRRERPLPTPDIDVIAADQIRGAIMAELFGVPAAPTRIGRFTVLERLGEGGMGVVYAAYDAQLDRKVAVKLLRPDTVGDDEGARKRLLREAQAMARVSHPNLITVHEVGEHNGAIFVAMEFVRGKSLDRWIAGKPGWREVVAVFLAAGRGLQAAHAAGIVHRDFKPHNVMRGDDGTVKVLDFGLARATGAAEPGEPETAPRALLDARMTRTGAVMGTPAYMAPEQHLGEVADARSDQYGFCVALYEGLFGQLPFTGETLPELIGNVLAARVLPPPDGAAPRWLARIVLRGLSLEPGDRFPSMEALLAALADDPVRRRRRAMAGAGLATLLAGGGFAVASMSQGTGPLPCAGAAEEMAEVWGEGRRAAAQAGLAAGSPTLGAQTWQTIAPRLDDHAAQWVAMRTGACEAHQAGRQSAPLLDLRMACLDRRKAGLAALASTFAAADEEVVLHAAAAVEGLGTIASCGDVERLTAVAPLPDDPRRAGEVRAQQLALERVAADQLTGRYPAAKAGAEAVAAAAATLDFAPLTAEAALARGRALQELREAEAADEALETALAAAIRGRADAEAAEAAARQIFVRGHLLGAPALGLAGAGAAEALLERAGDPPQARWLWELNVAIVRSATGAHEQARAHFRRAAEVAAAAGLEQSAAITVFNEGWVATLAGDDETAAERFGAGLAAIEATLGASHPVASQMRVMLAHARWELGRTAEVRAAMERELSRLLASFGPDAPDVQSLQLLAAEIAFEYRDFAAALAGARAVLERATHPGPAAEAARIAGMAQIGLGQVEEGVAQVRAAVERAGDNPELRTVQVSYVGDALLTAGRLDEALAAHNEALASFIAGVGEEAAYTATVRAHLARTLLARGALAEAHAAITAARDSLVAHQPQSPQLAAVYRTLGEIEEARGQPEAAAAALREAHARYASFDADHPQRNAARFALAQVLAAREPAEARALAREAAAIYEALGAGFAAEAGAVRTWLERQGR